MKRKILVMMATSIFCISLIGCSKKETEVQIEQEISTEQQADVDADPDKEADEPEEESIALPDGFVAATQEELNTISNFELFINNLSLASVSVGMPDVVKAVYGNYHNFSTDILENVNLDVYEETSDNKRLIASAMYLKTEISETWTIVSIKDVDSGILYYADDSVKETVDIYDYKTGELISEATKTSDELREEIQQGVEAAEQEFEDSLDELEESSGVATRDISKLEINGENIVDIAVKDMKEYDYIKDVSITVDEGSHAVCVKVQVPTDTDVDTAKMAGEDVARYFATLVGSANNNYRLPGSDNFGGIYDAFFLQIYIDDENKDLDLYGAKVPGLNKITW